MPQMSPIMWIWLEFFLIILFMMMITKIYFINFYPNLKYSNFKKKKFDWNWMW